MARGLITRQPSKSGRHDAASKARAVSAKNISPAKPLTQRQPKSPSPAKTISSPTVPATHQAKAQKKPPAGLSASGPKLIKTPAGYNPTSPERIREILKRLDQKYGEVTCALTHRNAWELLVATILSAQCTDARVNMVTPGLFVKYPTPADFAALQPEELEPDIRSTGFFRNKAKSIVGAAKKIVADFGGQVPHTMQELLTLPGVARKTANVVLGTWFKQADGVVVDTHVQRISRRLELTSNDEPAKIEQDLMQVIPRDKWILFAHQIIHHGRALCIARHPKCAECPLENLCHAADKTWSTVEMHRDAK